MQVTAWEVTVSDTGIGMSEAELARIFQEFYRVKSHKTSGIAGTGLGLATVKRVLGEYNGRITVHSKPDAGLHLHRHLSPRAEAGGGRGAGTGAGRGSLPFR